MPRGRAADQAATLHGVPDASDGEREQGERGKNEQRCELRAERESDGKPGEDDVDSTAPENEERRRGDERTDDEIVLGRHRLERDLRKRAGEKCGEGRRGSREADASRNAEDRDEQRALGEELRHRRQRVPADQDHAEEDRDLRVRGIGVDAERRRRIRNRLDRVVLTPGGDPNEVMPQRVPVVRRRRDPDHELVEEAERHDYREDEQYRMRTGVRERAAQSPERWERAASRPPHCDRDQRRRSRPPRGSRCA